jgi:hypothetical protein
MKLLMFLGTAATSITGGARQACGNSCNTNTTVSTIFHSVATTLTFVVGGVSVIMIIVGGLRYVLSNGDSKAITEAKHTTMYAVGGLVLAIMSYAIVNFVAINIK